MAQHHPLHGFVVLVVDDDADTLDALAKVLGEVFDCRVLSALSADEALHMIDSGSHIDLVFSDVVMPGKDGMTLFQQVHRRLPNLPVVLGTGRNDVVELVNKGGWVALLKPYSIDGLEAVFCEQLGVKRYPPPHPSSPQQMAANS